MPSLSHAHLQSSFRRLTAVFAAAVLLTLGTAVYFSLARTTVVITPIAKPKTVALALTIGPEGAGVDVPGQVTSEKKSATVTVKPTSATTPVPAHARGTVMVHNETNQDETLTSGTRLRATSGVIVRTVARINILSRTTAVVEAVADPVGAGGEIKPGRVTIVALPDSHSVFYGEVVEAFTGGTVLRAKTLGVEELTTASNDAQKQIQAAFGTSQPGIFRTLIPDTVGIKPAADVPSVTYDVTVTLTALSATYAFPEIQQRVRTEVEALLADDEAIVQIGQPTVNFDQQPASDRLTVSVTARAQTSLQPSSPVLQPSAMAGRPRDDVTRSLLGTTLVESVDIRLQPFWSTTLPADPRKIRVELQPAKLTPTPNGQSNN